MLAFAATIPAITAKYGAAVGSSIAAIDAPVTNAECPPPPRPGSSRRARDRRPTKTATASTQQDNTYDELDHMPDRSLGVRDQTQQQPPRTDRQHDAADETYAEHADRELRHAPDAVSPRCDVQAGPTVLGFNESRGPPRSPRQPVATSLANSSNAAIESSLLVPRTATAESSPMSSASAPRVFAGRTPVAHDTTQDSAA